MTNATLIDLIKAELSNGREPIRIELSDEDEGGLWVEQTEFSTTSLTPEMAEAVTRDGFAKHFPKLLGYPVSYGHSVTRIICA